MNKIIHGNCLEKLKTIKENSVDSIVTDPPYELGFMGKSWDNSGIAYKIEMWRECFRVLKPGGHLLSFGGTRTYHRMACAIEDAGFEIRDMIEWVYGSGFPKSLNVGKAVDKLQGNEREEYLAPIAKPDSDCWGIPNNNSTGEAKNPSSYNFKTENISVPGGMRRHTKGTSEWEGWGTALKPAHEPICMARKPLAEKTVAENCLKWRTGGINADESRIPTTDNRDREQKDGPLPNKYGFNNNSMGNRFVELSTLGRFPANLIHDNSEEVRECFPETGKSTGGRTIKRSGGTYVGGAGDNVKNWTNDDPGFGDSGNASRFFKSIIYTAKASKSERNKGNDLPFWFSGAKLREEKRKCYMAKANGTGEPSMKTDNFTSYQKNYHPTVKPIALMEYLIKMVTPKGGTVLDPFAGSGSTLVAAKQNGFQYIGIEIIEEYIPIIQCRVDAVKVARACLMFFDYQKNHHKRLKFTNNETPQSQNTKIKRRSSPPPQDNSTSNTKSKRKIKRRKK